MLLPALVGVNDAGALAGEGELWRPRRQQAPGRGGVDENTTVPVRGGSGGDGGQGGAYVGRFGEGVKVMVWGLRETLMSVETWGAAA